VPEMETEDEGRARAFWSGILSFGLVSIPVELLPAHRTSRGALRMLDADGTPLARRYYCPADETEVDPEHLVRGYELDNGKVVVVTDEELEALAPKKSREIDLRRFVDRDSIDPLYFERSYFLAPGADSGKAYRLLGTVMERSRRAGIATFVMRDKEYLIAIFAEGGLLRAQTLRFSDEVRGARDVGLPKRASVNAAAVKRLSRAVSTLAEKTWDPSELTDPHERIVELCERKYKQGKDVVKAGSAHSGEAGGEVVDLMEVLRQSLAQNDLAAKGSRGRTTGARASGGRAPRGRSKGAKKTGKTASASSPRRRTPSRAPSKSATARKKSAARRR
jgi:DNA end-binding protein Ku